MMNSRDAPVRAGPHARASIGRRGRHERPRSRRGAAAVVRSARPLLRPPASPRLMRLSRLMRLMRLSYLPHLPRPVRPRVL